MTSFKINLKWIICFSLLSLNIDAHAHTESHSISHLSGTNQMAVAPVFETQGSFVWNILDKISEFFHQTFSKNQLEPVDLPKQQSNLSSPIDFVTPLMHELIEESMVPPADILIPHLDHVSVTFQTSKGRLHVLKAIKRWIQKFEDYKLLFTIDTQKQISNYIQTMPPLQTITDFNLLKDYYVQFFGIQHYIHHKTQIARAHFGDQIIGHLVREFFPNFKTPESITNENIRNALGDINEQSNPIFKHVNIFGRIFKGFFTEMTTHNMHISGRLRTALLALKKESPAAFDLMKKNGGIFIRILYDQVGYNDRLRVISAEITDDCTIAKAYVLTLVDKDAPLYPADVADITRQARFAYNELAAINHLHLNTIKKNIAMPLLPHPKG